MKWNTNAFWISATPTLILLAVAALALASPLTIPNTFTPGTTADANQVNANFAAVETAVDDNDGRITTLEGLPPHVIAAAHVSSTLVVTRSFSRLSGSPAITVSHPAVGRYEVDFGTSVAGRYYSASLGHSGNATHPPLFGGQISVSPKVTNVNRLEIITTDSTGVFMDIAFYVVVY